MDEIINKILSNITITDKDFILFNEEKKAAVKIQKQNFFDIPDKKLDKKIAFIDGGNLEILRSPSLSLFFNRIYYTIYQNNKRIKNQLYEFYTLITAVNKENKLFFKTEYLFTKNKFEIKEYEFDSFDKTLTTGSRRVSISLIGNIIRRFSELIVAKEFDSDYVVIDGSLEPKYPYEEELIDLLGKKVCGLSKTTELLTKNGNTVTTHLAKITDKKTWCHKINDNLSFLKLHSKSRYVFKFETFNENIEELLALLKQNSKDPIFLGYPYGLIEADKFARVSNKDKEMLKLQLQFKLKDKFELIEPYIKSLDAHDVLDSIG